MIVVGGGTPQSHRSRRTGGQCCNTRCQRRQLVALRHLQELEALRDSLTHMIVHDLKSPLTVIHAYLELLKKAAGLAKGSGVPNKDKVGKVTMAQVDEIVRLKLADLNARDAVHARRMVEGTARSMGITVEG